MKQKKTNIMIFCALFAALTAIGAFIRIPTPLIPLTLQDFFSTLAGILLGPVYGPISVLVYVLIGLVGVPVFTFGGGIGSLIRPSFGFIIGFVFGAWITGKIAWKKEKPTVLWLFFASMVGIAVIYLFGTIYCYLVSRFVLGKAVAVWPLLMSCMVMPFPGDVAKMLLASWVGSRVLPIVWDRYLSRK